MNQNIDAEVEQQEARAAAIQRNLLHFASRAFVIEFAGTPKSGKSTSVEAVRHFLSRNGFRVHVLTERASACPIPMKGHLFFNTWCLCTMLAELIENVDTETDIIIVDRGIFDALVWLTLQRNRAEVTDDEAQTIEAFLLLARWKSLIDLVVVMQAAPEEAIRRENNQRLSQKSGSIMNLDVLSKLTESVAKTAEKHHRRFSATVNLDTSGRDVRESNLELAKKFSID